MVAVRHGLPLGIPFLCALSACSNADEAAIGRTTSAVVVGPAVPLDAPIVGSLQADIQRDAVVASNGSGYLVAWGDQRGGAAQSRVIAGRIDESGQLLDPLGIDVGCFGSPAVASDGTNYLVVCGTGTPGTGSIGVRMAPDGTVLDTIPIAGSGQSVRDVAFVGGNYLVVWGYPEIGAARVSADGMLLDSQGIPFGATGIPKVATDGTDALVVWREIDDKVRGRVVGSDGVLQGTEPFLIATDAGTPHSVTWGGDRYLISWRVLSNPGDVNPFSTIGATFDSDGSLIDSQVIASQREGAVGAWNGTAFTFFTWFTSAIGVRVASLSPTMLMSDDREFFPRSTRLPEVAVSSSNQLVVFVVDDDVWAQRLDLNGANLDQSPFRVSVSANQEVQPRIAVGADHHLAVWVDNRDADQSAIYGIRLDLGGTPLDPAAFRISSGGKVVASPDVAFDGTRFLVVWERRDENTHIGARFVDAAGIPDASGEFVIVDELWNQLDPRVAFDGTNYLVVWDETRVLPEPLNSFEAIFGTRVSSDGTLLDGEGQEIANGYSGSPAVAAVQGGFLIAWAAALENEGIHARSVATGGGLGALHTVHTVPPQGAMDMATAGGSALLAWTESDLTGLNVFAATLTSNAIGGTPFGITAGEHVQFLRGLTWTGDGFLAITSDLDSNSTSGRYLTGSGQIFGSSFPVHPAAVSGGAARTSPDGTTVFVYEEYDPSWAAVRLFSRAIGPPPADAGVGGGDPTPPGDSGSDASTSTPSVDSGASTAADSGKGSPGDSGTSTSVVEAGLGGGGNAALDSGSGAGGVRSAVDANTASDAALIPAVDGGVGASKGTGGSSGAAGAPGGFREKPSSGGTSAAGPTSAPTLDGGPMPIGSSGGDAGCGCRLAGTRPANGSPFVATLGFLLLCLRPRRRAARGRTRMLHVATS